MPDQIRDTPPDPRIVRRHIASGLVRARRSAGLTQAQLADRLDLTVSAVRHRERARRSLRTDEIPRYAVALRLSIRSVLVLVGMLDPTSPCGDCLAVATAQLQERRNPGQPAGAVGDGSPKGGDSTVYDPRGDASHDQSSAQTAPEGRR